MLRLTRVCRGTPLRSSSIINNYPRLRAHVLSFPLQSINKTMPLRGMSIFSSMRQNKNQDGNQQFTDFATETDVDLFCSTAGKFDHHVAAVEAFLKTIHPDALGHNFMVKENIKNVYEEEEMEKRADDMTWEDRRTPEYKHASYVPDWKVFAKELVAEGDLGGLKFKEMYKQLESLSEEEIIELQKSRHLLQQVDMIAADAKPHKPEELAFNPIFLHVDDQSTPLSYFDVHGNNIEQGKTVVALRAPLEMAQLHQARDQTIVDAWNDAQEISDMETEEPGPDFFNDEDVISESTQKDIKTKRLFGSEEEIHPDERHISDDPMKAEPHSTHIDIKRRGQIRNIITKRIKDPLDPTGTLEQLRTLNDKMMNIMETRDHSAKLPYLNWDIVIKQMIEMYEKLEGKTPQEIKRYGRELLANEMKEIDKREEEENHFRSVKTISDNSRGNFQHQSWGVIDWGKRTFTVNQYDTEFGIRISNTIHLSQRWFNSFKEVYWPPFADSIDYQPLNFASYSSMIDNEYVISPAEQRRRKERKEKESKAAAQSTETVAQPTEAISQPTEKPE